MRKNFELTILTKKFWLTCLEPNMSENFENITWVKIMTKYSVKVMWNCFEYYKKIFRMIITKNHSCRQIIKIRENNFEWELNEKKYLVDIIRKYFDWSGSID